MTRRNVISVAARSFSGGSTSFSGVPCPRRFSGGSRSFSGVPRSFSGVPRSFSTKARKEVMISQSRDVLSNTALEDWAARNLNLKEKSVLILSNNITLNRTVEIKATLVDENISWRTEEFTSLILSAISSSDLPLAKIPDFKQCDGTCEPLGTSVSIHLELTQDVETRVVLRALEKIGWRFLRGDTFEASFDCPTHLSLVRPDDGWFPGLENIRRDLEENTVERLKAGGNKIDRANTARFHHNEDYTLQNSFGNV